MTATLAAVPDVEPDGPPGSVGAVAVSHDTMMMRGDLVAAWRVRVQCLDGSGRFSKVRAYRPQVSDGQAAVEEMLESHGLGVEWSVVTSRIAVGFLVTARLQERVDTCLNGFQRCDSGGQP